jgi:phosphoribosylaminoimidazole-succinocarboxamide synthase
MVVNILKIQEGKTKTVFQVEDGNILLHFKDDVTGVEGLIDPGANSVIGKIEGKGNASLKLSKHFFELFQSSGIHTHYIKANIEQNTMLVKKAVMFGDGLEFICRLKATGSFIRRYGKYIREGEPLDYLVEITLKDDEKGDPLVNEQALSQLNLMSEEEVIAAKELTKKVTKIVQDECERFGLELVDIKIEFGKIDGKLAVIDEVSGDNMRVRKDGKRIDQIELCRTICSV